MSDTPTLTRRLGAGALILGVTAAFAGNPYNTRRGRIAVDDIVRVIDDGGDHVTARQLAYWIRDRKPGLRVIDVRKPAEFAMDALPTAENLPLDTLMRTNFHPEETVVLYSEGGAHAAQAWVLLRALGVHNAWFIAGGMTDWHDEVLMPVLKPGNSADAELSRYFDGEPTFGDPVVDPMAMPTRRGC